MRQTINNDRYYKQKITCEYLNIASIYVLF